MPVAIADATSRRTQGERRSTTRQALLDASLACLLDGGYSGLTTRRVALRAGVSPATLRWYFPSRAAFVAAAVEQLAIVLRREFGDLSVQQPAPPVERFRRCLDELWRLCNGPTFLVMIELSSAAYAGDLQAQEGLAVAERGVTRQVALAAKEFFPDQIDSPRFRALLDLATCSMRGLAMFQPVTKQAELRQRWLSLREELTTSYQALLDRPEASA